MTNPKSDTEGPEDADDPGTPQACNETPDMIPTNMTPKLLLLQVRRTAKRRSQFETNKDEAGGAKKSRLRYPTRRAKITASSNTPGQSSNSARGQSQPSSFVSPGDRRRGTSSNPRLATSEAEDKTRRVVAWIMDVGNTRQSRRVIGEGGASPSRFGYEDHGSSFSSSSTEQANKIARTRGTRDSLRFWDGDSDS